MAKYSKNNRIRSKKYHIFALLLCIFTSYCISSHGQAPDENLIYNPGFESYQDCPRKIDALGILTIVDAWFQPTNGSADYFNTCGMKECFVPNNKLGIQEPHSGIDVVLDVITGVSA